MTVRLLPDGRTHEQAVDEYLELVRASPDARLIGADASAYGREIDAWLACKGQEDPRFPAIAEAFWRHFEELNP